MIPTNHLPSREEVLSRYAERIATRERRLRREAERYIHGELEQFISRCTQDMARKEFNRTRGRIFNRYLNEVRDNRTHLFLA